MEPIKPIKRPLNPAYTRSVDGMMRRPAPAPQPFVGHQTATVPARPQPAPQPVVKPKPAQKRTAGWVAWLQMAIVIVAGVGGGLIFQFLPLGQVAVIIYGIIAIVRRVPSFITFIVLMVAFVLLAGLSAIGNFGLITENIAMYAFYLFITALISAALELKRANKQPGINTLQGVPIEQT